MRVWSIPCHRLLPTLLLQVQFNTTTVTLIVRGEWVTHYYGLHVEEATYMEVVLGLPCVIYHLVGFQSWRCLSQLLLQAVLILTLSIMKIVLCHWI